ncbi:MAG TPA: META domain-containing protein [Usitatibacter sp.]|nr:META domain-containing protein [Usitatibacter sp.]
MNARFASLALCMAAMGCAMTQREPPPTPFAGTRWDVVLERPLPGEPPNFRFADGRMEGFGGCNRVEAPYVQDTIGARAIALRRLQVDNQPCDAAAKAVEMRVLSVLQSVSSYSITADVMTMNGSAGALTLRAHGQETKR